MITGVDGEAIDDRYCLLAAEPSGDHMTRKSGKALTTIACLNFLCEQGAKSKRLFGYGIGYDVAHWIKGLSTKKKVELAETGQCRFNGLLYNYAIRYAPGRLFEVARYHRHTGERQSACVVDLCAWGRKSFVATLAEWDIINEDAILEVGAMKDARSIFSLEMIDRIKGYNSIECASIAHLGNEIITGLKDLGIIAAHPLLPGAIAGHTAARYGVSEFLEEIPDEVHEAARKAFFGGREQTVRFGHFENVRQYDLRSAYGWALAQLPDMLGTWRWTGHFKPNERWAIWNVSLDCDDNSGHIMPFSFRHEKGKELYWPKAKGGKVTLDRDCIVYPPKGNSWQWSPVVRSTMKHYHGRVSVLGGWVYTPRSDTKPFEYMQDLFENRKNVSPAMANIIKLVIVATWGRLCTESQHPQAKGNRSCIEWAGMATSLVSARLFDAMTIEPDDVISCCVDGFWTTANLDGKLGVSDFMGNWSVKEAEELLLARHTAYWKKVNGVWSGHCAGLPGATNAAEMAMEAWNEHQSRGSITSIYRTCRGIMQCNLEKDWSKLGEFYEREFKMSMNPGSMGHFDPQCIEKGRPWQRWLPYWPPVFNGSEVSGEYSDERRRPGSTPETIAFNEGINV